MAKFTLLPKDFHLSKRSLLFLVVASAISLNLLLTCAVLYFHKRDFLGQFILSQTQTILEVLTNEVANGNYRRVMEQLASSNKPMGAQTKSILFYNLSDKEIFTSNNESEILRCRQDFTKPYYESFQNTYVVCVPINSMLFIQIVFKANWLYFLQTPQFLMILAFNLVFAIALTLLTLLGMNLYLDRFISLLNKLLKEGTLDKNMPREFYASFDSIKQLSSALEYLKARISKHTQETVLNELSQKVLHNIKAPLGVINATLPLLKEGGNEEESIIRNAMDDIKTSVTRALSDHKDKQKALNTINLYQIVEQACADARLQCADKEKIKILPIKACEFSQVYAKRVDPVDFKSAITNILNNSIEATPESGNIQIEMSKEGEAVKICITDEGTGIAEDVLPYVGEKGFSGKRFGNGLGIYSLKKDIHFWGGSFTIGNRREQKGVEVIIIL